MNEFYRLTEEVYPLEPIYGVYLHLPHKYVVDTGKKSTAIDMETRQTNERKHMVIEVAQKMFMFGQFDGFIDQKYGHTTVGVPLHIRRSKNR